MTTLLWFRRDLRLSDNPALQAALARRRAIVPVFVLDDEDAGDWAPGGASRWWLHGSLQRLAQDLRGRGSRLILRRGCAETVLDTLLDETGADAICWNRRYEPWAIARDERVTSALKRRGVEASSFNSSLLKEPWALKTQSGGPYRVFTPFWKTLLGADHSAAPTAAPKRIAAPSSFPPSDDLASWGLKPTAPDWAATMRTVWTPGEAGALARLDEFVDRVAEYPDARDRPGVEGTSRLSPHLHFGEIGPRQIWHAVAMRALAETGHAASQGAETYLSEIGWREFSYHLLFHFPSLPEQPLRPEFTRFPWADNTGAFKAWQRGRTGYPIVDAGMRELWATGWMHNRVRMIAASFLIKDVLLDWRLGERWFWDTLVDADLANNSASWQWVAGSGADAAAYFRVFNPSLQGTKFDPDGNYVRRWVPELAKLPDKILHVPWTARPIDLADAGVNLGRTYPLPIVDHARARARALAAYRRIKRAAQ